MENLFSDRMDAGKQLAEALIGFQTWQNLLVLALPRGGVPVGFQVAQALGAPLDVFVVRKLGVPENEELAMGAIASGGVRVFDNAVIDRLEVSDKSIAVVANYEEHELRRREALYRGDFPPLAIKNHNVILVDDGIATGSTMRAAVLALKPLHPKKLVVATPVAATETIRQLEKEVDGVVCLKILQNFSSVSQVYEDFEATTDDTVCELLLSSRTPEQEVSLSYVR